MKILIIEDEDVLLDVLQRKLKFEGYEVAVARDGREGLEQIKKINPDLILLDILMPKMNGFEVLTAMRADAAISDIPVIVISNSGQPVEIDRILKMGVKDYLVKTEFDPQEVLDKVAKQLSQKQNQTQQFAMNNTQSKQNKTGAIKVVLAQTDAAVETGGKKKVLIIEDDRFLRELIVRKLEEEGFEALAAIDGQEGIKAIGEQKPDLILLDLILPGIDGFEVLKKAKEDPRSASIPVIILSNLGQREDVERGLNLGANDFLIKAHFTPGEVIEKVKSYL